MSSNLWFISTTGILMLSGFLVVVAAELKFLARLPAFVDDYLLGVASLSINSCIFSALCSYSAFAEAAPIVVLWWICWLLWFLCRFSTIGWISFLSRLKLYLYWVFWSTSWIKKCSGMPLISAKIAYAGIGPLLLLLRDIWAEFRLPFVFPFWKSLYFWLTEVIISLPPPAPAVYWVLLAELGALFLLLLTWFTISPIKGEFRLWSSTAGLLIIVGLNEGIF